jgi:sulfur-oxidizing protein SoxY
MRTDRRNFCALSAGALTLAMAGSRVASADGHEVDERVAEFTGGVEPTAGTIELKAPEIAENGNTVPISVSVDSPMTEDNYVSEVMILAAGNPLPGVATFKFSPMSGSATASTRIRLAKTQDLIALAKMSDGSMFMDQKSVKVTIGGCGG